MRMNDVLKILNELNEKILTHDDKKAVFLNTKRNDCILKLLKAR